MMTREEADTLLRSHVVFQDAILAMMAELKDIRRLLDQQNKQACPPGVAAAVNLVQSTFYLAHNFDSSLSVIDEFEKTHQSIMDRIKHEQGNVHVPAPAAE